MKCLNCKEEFETDNPRRKFCSGKCKVAHFRKHGKRDEITHLKLTALYNEIKDFIQSAAEKQKVSGFANIEVQPKVVNAPIQANYQQSAPLSQSEVFMQKIMYADNLKEIQGILNEAKRAFNNWKLYAPIEKFAEQVKEKKGFVYND